ncbi:MAG: L-2-amino-thiazoline-4-carboxylic acid hydrolase [Candidatus Thorarchaeota archaeon]
MTEEDPNQQLVDYFSQLTNAELVKRFGDTKGNGLHQLYERQFKIHWNNYIHMLPDDVAKRHGINSLFVMALDDVLRETRASYTEFKDAVLTIYRTMLLDYFKEEAEKLHNTGNPWNAFVEWAKKGNEANYNNEYFQLTDVDAGENCYGFDIKRCLYFEVLKEAGRPELGPILCEYDRILASTLESWIGFKRHETIALGDRRCTFRYCKK